MISDPLTIPPPDPEYSSVLSLSIGPVILLAQGSKKLPTAKTTKLILSKLR